jgi:hypothetical protein
MNNDKCEYFGCKKKGTEKLKSIEMRFCRGHLKLIVYKFKNGMNQIEKKGWENSGSSTL